MRHPFKIWLLAILVTFSSTFTAGLYAQTLVTGQPKELGFSPDRLQRLTDRFEQYIDDKKMAGSVILVARKGEVAYYEAIGMADIEAKKAMQKDAIFRIASQSKAIVSVGVMILQEQGKLLISDKVGDYIPEFAETTVAEPNEDGGYEVVKAKRAITIRDLLTHTAGINYGYGIMADAWSEAGIQGWYFADRDETISEVIPRIASLPNINHPGEKFVYGYNTDILGLVIEKVSGMPLDKFLQQEILDPLGMNDTHFFLPKNKAGRLATVYNPQNGELKPAPVEGTMNSQGAYIDGPRKCFSGGAGLLSTAKDYYLFLQMMANGGELNGKRILAPSTVQLMTSDHLHGIPYNDGMGFGLGFDVVLDVGAHGTYGSLGTFGWGGAYGSTYWVDPVEELVVVYFTQLRPGSVVKDQQMLRTLIYQSIISE
ncbi:MAG: serine hydrolase domain-containing protein [Bacteroidota bacterium]